MWVLCDTAQDNTYKVLKNIKQKIDFQHLISVFFVQKTSIRRKNI